MKKKRVIKPPKKIGGKFGAIDWTTSNTDLKKLAKLMSITKFRGIYGLNNLPTKPKQSEKVIIRINGNPWVSYIKNGKSVRYFNSIGNKEPPVGLKNYFKGVKIT